MVVISGDPSAHEKLNLTEVSALGFRMTPQPQADGVFLLARAQVTSALENSPQKYEKMLNKEGKCSVNQNKQRYNLNALGVCWI